MDGPPPSRRGERLQIEAEAARLVVDIAARHDPAARAAAHAAAMRWVAEHPLHAVSFARADAAWRMAERLRSSPPALDPETIAGPAGWMETMLGRRSVVRGLIAATIVGGVSVVAIERVASVDRYRTGVGERRAVRLADGSTIDLNTNTVVEVALRRHERSIHLLSGEAMFEVAHDPARPFLVEAGPATLRAIGTAFNVRLRDELVELTVTQGVVTVRDGPRAEHPVRAGGGAAIRAGATAPTGLDVKAVRQRLAWRQGEIDLDGDTIPQAVAEFNRYRSTPLVVADDRLAAIRVGGRFGVRDSAKFVEALELGFGIRAVPGPDQSALLVKAD